MEKQSLYSIKRGFSIKRPATNKFIKKKKKKKTPLLVFPLLLLRNVSDQIFTGYLQIANSEDHNLRRLIYS